MGAQSLDEKAIFKVASSIESAEARHDYLSHVCGDDQELLRRVTVLLNSDEEIGSHKSRAAIERLAGEHDLGLSFESGKIAEAAGGGLTLARKGILGLEIVIYGESAHSGVRLGPSGTPATRRLRRMEPEAWPKPVDDSGGLDEDECFTPAGPETPQRDPEHSVAAPQPGSGSAAAEHRHLVTESEILGLRYGMRFSL